MNGGPDHGQSANASRRAEPSLPEPLTLPALQVYVRKVVVARNFTTDLNEIFILLVEEVGELATELKRHRLEPQHFAVEALGFELVDILLYLLDLANGLAVDLMATWPAGDADQDACAAPRSTPNHNTGPIPAAAPETVTLFSSLNALRDQLGRELGAKGLEEHPERLALLLAEKIGQIATELRRHWKGPHRPAYLARGLIDAVRCLLRLANWFHIDLEQAVRKKEQVNAGRTWTH